MSASVYILAEEGADRPVKIGHTVDAQARFSSLQTGNHRVLIPHGNRFFKTPNIAQRIEASLHQKFANRRLRGEWFDVSAADAISALRSEKTTKAAANNPALAIIEKFGGIPAVAKICGVDVSRVHRWTYPKEKGGSDGIIPPKRQNQLLAAAVSKGVELKRDDFFPEIKTQPSRKVAR